MCVVIVKNGYLESVNKVLISDRQILNYTRNVLWLLLI